MMCRCRPTRTPTDPTRPRPAGVAWWTQPIVVARHGGRGPVYMPTRDEVRDGQDRRGLDRPRADRRGWWRPTGCRSGRRGRRLDPTKLVNSHVPRAHGWSPGNRRPAARDRRCVRPSSPPPFTPAASAYDQRHPPFRRGLPPACAVLDDALFGPRPSLIKADLKAILDAVQEKNLQFFYDYRGQRRPHLRRPQGTVRRRISGGVRQAPQDDPEPRAAIWEIAQGKSVPATIDDSNTGEFARSATNFSGRIRSRDPRRN